MAYYRPQRHQARPSRFDDDYIAAEPGNAYDPYDDLDPYAPRDRYPSAPLSPPRSPPRRHKSERRRRRPSPGPGPNYPDEPMMASRHPEPRARPRQYVPDPDRRGRSAGPDRRSRELSPPPFGPPPDSPRRKARSARPAREPRYEPEPRFEREQRPKEPRSGRDIPVRSKRDRRAEKEHRSGRGAPMNDPYEQDPYARGPPPGQYPDEPRGRRAKTWAPEPDEPRHSRNAMPPSPRSRSRPRGRASRHPGSDDDDFYAAGAGAAGAAGAAAARGRRRPRSQDRDYRGRAPARSSSRGRPPNTQKTRGGNKARRNSMPAITKERAMSWWNNPLVQAGARTAFTAGAQAAMKSRHDSGAWIGPKGAKVATAALGAALVDGFMGQKHPDSMRQKVMRHGVDLAQEGAVHVPEHHGHSSRSRHRH